MNKDELINVIKNNLGNDISIDDIKRELDKYICLLTRSNADLVERSINRDPRYPNKMRDYIIKLGIYQNESSIPTIRERLDREHLEEYIWIVATENSIQGKRPIVKTHIADFILNSSNFYERLRAGDWSLVEDMEAEVYTKNLGRRINRHECSWCSKICKYLHEALFNNDAYYIYDNNVKNRLNDYRKKYNLSSTPKRSINIKYNENWYQNLCLSMDELKEKRNGCGENLTRSEIDHILWGFTKYPVEVSRIK